MAKVYATGRRKTAVAKVWLENGNGQLTINGQTLDAWLGGHESIKKRDIQPIAYCFRCGKRQRFRIDFTFISKKCQLLFL